MLALGYAHAPVMLLLHLLVAGYVLSSVRTIHLVSCELTPPPCSTNDIVVQWDQQHQLNQKHTHTKNKNKTKRGGFA